MHDRRSAEEFVCARASHISAKIDIIRAQENHSCRGKGLDLRCRHRRDEALPPDAGRK